ncbi:MAG: CBS domain-containing protein [Candidatus Dadabacteria bacterium]|nr:CBS domain-containing protein [Candidatus Dadabacteria bacterium]NIS09097.1 CBS domain-containing protein [Candidatus Dadabacteria bacterium]NIV41533.1 CBS domain-containing protein [Candidatus Dadabacteria bacterium]NIX15214.1 CBS domain-containing protein [Candidatus Dadabacteria bacterium]NIY21858.1 CBS domain-containing protein [Candidatus Dadabacteria bacterium]
MLVQEIMVSPVITVRPDDTLKDIAKIMIKQRIGCVPVVNKDSELEGIITENEFTAYEKRFPFSRQYAPRLFGRWITEDNIDDLYEEAKKIYAKDLMITNPVTVDMEDSVFDLLKKMIDQSVDRVPVLNKNRVVGIVARHDLLKLIVDKS